MLIYLIKILMSSLHPKDPCFNTIFFNKSEYAYNKFNSDEILKYLKFDSIKMPSSSDDKKMPSNYKNEDILKRKLIKLFQAYPDGIQLEKFSNSYLLQFGCTLIPQEHGFSDIVNLFTHYKDVLTLKKGPNNSILIVRVENEDISEENFIADEMKSQTQIDEKIVPDEVLNVFSMILSSYGGGTSLDNLISEYEARSGKKFCLEEFNVSSIFELVPHLGPRFQLCNINKLQSVIYDSEQLHNCPCKNSLYSSNISCTEDEGTRMEKLTLVKELHNEKLFMRLVDILVEEFPQGLYLEEIICAYKGFYDANGKDLESFKTLEDLRKRLEKENGFFNFIRQHEKIFVTAGAFYQDRLKDATMSLNVVSFSSSYQTVDLSMFKEGEFIDVNVADVYNPKKFWIIKRGKENSQTLDEMMDRMLEFYGGEIGKRFLIPKENAPNIPGSPVVALYSQDMNFYRAILLSREDVQNVKIFYIDYGTNDIISLSSLYYLHRRFFDFPAQAVKCSLHGIKPANKKTFWPKSHSLQFLDMTCDQPFVAYINKNEANENLQITLYDTTGKEEININQYLIDEGYASPDESELSVDHYERISVASNEEIFKALKNSELFSDTKETRNEGFLSNSLSNSFTNSPKAEVAPKQLTNSSDSKLNMENACSSSTYERNLLNDCFEAPCQSKDRKVCPAPYNTKGFSFRSIASSLDYNNAGNSVSFEINSSTLNNTSEEVNNISCDNLLNNLNQKYSEVSDVFNAALNSNADTSAIKKAATVEDTESTLNSTFVLPFVNEHSFSLANQSNSSNYNTRNEIYDHVDMNFLIPEKQTFQPLSTFSQGNISIDSSSPVKRDLSFHSNMEEIENEQAISHSQHVLKSSTPVSKSKMITSNLVTKPNEPKINKWENEFESVKTIEKNNSLLNSLVDKNDREVFYSDDSDISSTSDGDSDCKILTPIYLSNGSIVHVIFLNLTYYIPLSELPLLMDFSSLERLEAALSQEDQNGDFILSISRRKHFYIYMLLAREGVSYVFSSNGSVPKTLEMLSLDYLIHFLSVDMKESSLFFMDLIGLQVDSDSQPKKQPYNKGSAGSSLNDKECTFPLKEQNSLISNLKKICTLNKVTSLPSDLKICKTSNEECSDISSNSKSADDKRELNEPDFINLNVTVDNTECCVTSISNFTDVGKELKEQKTQPNNISNEQIEAPISQYVDNTNNDNSFPSDPSLKCVTDLKVNKTNNKHVVEDKNDISQESVIPINSTVNIPNHMHPNYFSLDLPSPVNVINKPLLNNTLPLESTKYLSPVRDEMHDFSSLNNTLPMSAKDRKPHQDTIDPYHPYPYQMIPAPPFVSSAPFRMMSAPQPNFYNPGYMWPSQYYPPSYGVMNDHYHNFFRNFIFPNEYNASFRPL